MLRGLDLNLRPLRYEPFLNQHQSRSAKQHVVNSRAAHAERGVRRLTGVVVKPSRELREHALRIAQLGRPEIVTLERPDKRFG